MINRPILDVPTYITSLHNIPQCFLIQDDLVFPLIVFCTWYLEFFAKLVALIFHEKNGCYHSFPKHVLSLVISYWRHHGDLECYNFSKQEFLFGYYKRKLWYFD